MHCVKYKIRIKIIIFHPRVTLQTDFLYYKCPVRFTVYWAEKEANAIGIATASGSKLSAPSKLISIGNVIGLVYVQQF